MKACMIVSVWFGKRSKLFNSPERAPDQLNFFRDVFMDHAVRVDPGVDMDLVIVMNQDKKFPQGYSYVASLDGTDINRGKVRTIERRNSEGKGFDGFAHGFDVVQDEYDYFLFCEDDVVFFLDDYYRMGIETFEKNQPIAACVGYSPKSLPSMSKRPSHFGGGLLMSSREKLKTVAKEYAASRRRRHADRRRRVTVAPRLPGSEVAFTDEFHHCLPKDTPRVWPAKIVDQPHLLWVDGLSPFARNWYHVSGQAKIYDLVVKQWVKYPPDYMPALKSYHDKWKRREPTCYFVGVERPFRKKSKTE